MSFELRQLRHFESLYRIKNFRLAAEEQNLTHSALTKSIRKLEQDLGVRLFDRTTRIVEPTSAGTHLMEKVRVLLDQAESLTLEAKLVTGAQIGRLRIGAGPIPTDTLIPLAISRLAKEHPDVVVDVICDPPEDLVEQLVSGGLDLAIFDSGTFRSEKYKNELAADPLQSEDYVALYRAGHPIANMEKTDEALHSFPWAVAVRKLASNDTWPSVFDQRNSAAAQGPRYRFQSLSGCAALAFESDALIAAPRSVAQKFKDVGLLEHCEFPETWKWQPQIFSLKRRSFSPVAQAMVSCLHEVSDETHA